MTLEWVEKWAQWELIKDWICWAIIGLVAACGIIFLIVVAILNKVNDIKRQKRKDKDNGI